MTAPILIVEPHEHFRTRLTEIVRTLGGDPTTHSVFQHARQHIAATPHSVIVTNVKLGSFNGIHLVYLARMGNPNVVCIVHGDEDASSLGLEAQRAGAFYERTLFLPFSLHQYLNCDLPPADRRDVRRVDRRSGPFRGGRRATDQPGLHAAMTSLPRQ